MTRATRMKAPQTAVAITPARVIGLRRRRSFAADDRRRRRPMTRAGVMATAVWGAFILVALVIVIFARYTTDLSAFLPRSPTATQRLLVDQLREGIASRLILIGIEGADPAERARISLSMGRRVRANPQSMAPLRGRAGGAATGPGCLSVPPSRI